MKRQPSYEKTLAHYQKTIDEVNSPAWKSINRIMEHVNMKISPGGGHVVLTLTVPGMECGEGTVSFLCGNYSNPTITIRHTLLRLVLFREWWKQDRLATLAFHGRGGGSITRCTTNLYDCLMLFAADPHFFREAVNSGSPYIPTLAMGERVYKGGVSGRPNTGFVDDAFIDPLTPGSLVCRSWKDSFGNPEHEMYDIISIRGHRDSIPPPNPMGFTVHVK